MGNQLVAVASLLLVACDPRYLPPPATPDNVMPPLPPPEVTPVEGEGQVAIAADEPAIAEEVTGHAEGISPDGWPVDEITYRTVCSTTPCVTSLRFGAHDLRLTSRVDPQHHYGTGTITVGPQPIDYHYALGHNNLAPHFASGLLTTIGGATAWMSGVFMYAFTQKPDQGLAPTSSWGTAGLATLAVGTIVTLIGVHLLSDGGTAQEGTGTQWTP